MVTDHYFVIGIVFLLLLNYTTAIPPSTNLNEGKSKVWFNNMDINTLYLNNTRKGSFQ